MELRALIAPLMLVACSAETPSTAQTSADQTAADQAPTLSLPADKSELVEIGWRDLMPPGEEELIAEIYQQQMLLLFETGGVAEGSAQDIAMQFGTFNTVPELDGRRIRLPGYTVPFEFGKNAEVSEFLLVPYFGACLHAPPPPPNQTVYVTTDNAIRLGDLAQAVWVEGMMRTKSAYNELGDAAYTIEIDKIETYVY
ncbi:MAG: DUF3299 domain-containing protein [Pseudomonadota bacterium]